MICGVFCERDSNNHLLVVAHSWVKCSIAHNRLVVSSRGTPSISSFSIDDDRLSKMMRGISMSLDNKSLSVVSTLECSYADISYILDMNVD